MSIVLSASGLTKTYQQGEITVPALQGIDLEIEKGDFVVLAGPSGSGKTTLLNLFGALDEPSSGTVVVDGTDLAGLNRRGKADLRRDRIGFVFQSYNLVPVLTAYENAELILMLQGVPEADRRARVMPLLKAVGLEGMETRRPNQLSGGQQQRVAVARALAPKPAIVLADEPTANLDSKTSTALLDTMRELNETSGTTFVFSSHDQKVIDRARRLVWLEDGLVANDTSTPR
jgi:putative ABC transport system ATP-binding protein